jgi:thiol-disulfide isomerase/thioredoxin
MCLSLAGCKSLGKKDSAAASSGGKGTGAGLTGSPARTAPAAPAPALENVASGGNVNGVLAGQVLDPSRHRLPGAYIQVSEAGEVNRRGAPIEIAADKDGYFVIPGVASGHRYQLTARARDGGRLLSGAVWATPPDARLVICVNDETGMPPAADRGWGQGNNFPAQPGRPAELGPPQGAATPWPPPPAGPQAPPPDPPPSTQNDVLDPRTRIRPQDTTQDHAQAPTSPLMAVPGQTMPRTATPPSNGWTAPGAVAPFAPPPPQFGPARVPSCQLTGQTLYNFALNDLSGQPWEYRQRRGRLMLVDFWGTWCVHCLHAVPHLNVLQERYGPYGLEVVGIAYETGTPAEQVRKVNDVRNRLHMNYRVLMMGSDRETCPVRQQFGVKNWPTMVLLDESGRIIWRGEGFEVQHFRELEVIIQQRLAAR